MGANLHANGGLLLQGPQYAELPRLRGERNPAGNRAVASTRILGQLLRDVMRLNADTKNFRVFGPTRPSSNRLDALFETTDKTFMEPRLTNGRASFTEWRVHGSLERTYVPGLLEGYLLTGRHGFFLVL